MAWEGWMKFTRLFRPKLDVLVGVDFSDGAVKVAEVSLAGAKPLMRTFSIVEGSAAQGQLNNTANTEAGWAIDVEALTKQLERALSLSGVQTKYAVLAVGAKTAFVREVVFPKLPPDELAEAIKWEIPKYVPYEPDSYEFDYAIIGQDSKTNDLRVLIVAAPKKIINQLVQTARNAGLVPIAIDIEPLAVYRTVSGADNSLVLNMGGNDTQLSLFQNGSLSVTRLLSTGSVQLDAALAKKSGNGPDAEAELDDILEELGDEIRRTSQFFNLQNKQTVINKVVVTGNNNYDTLVSLLRTKTELPVVGHNPLSGLAISPSISAAHVQKLGPQLAVAVGLAMRGDEP